MHRLFRPAGLALALLFFSCSTDVDLNAPPKDIWIVYGVLNPQDTAQYVRVARAFLPEGDALQYAMDSNLSVQGLRVVLKGNNQTYEAVQADSVLKDTAGGIFFPYTTLYRISTAGSRRLTEGRAYDLEITRALDDSFRLEARTVIPERLRFNAPILAPGPGQTQCLRQTPLELDYRVDFARGTAAGYEIRVRLDYEENGQPRSVVYGPTPLFTDNIRCTTGSSNICYQFRAYEVLQSLFNQMNHDAQAVYTYDVREDNRCKENVSNLPRVFRFEVTAMDCVLTDYRRANDQGAVDLNEVRPEYTNIEASGGDLAFGILGSVSLSESIARLSPCGEYLLRLNGVAKPEGICEF